MKRLLIASAILLYLPASLAQVPSQNLKGTITDLLGEPVLGATIKWLGDSVNVRGTASDLDGNFVIPSIPVGRQSFLVESVQYRNQLIENVIITSAKEVVLKIVLEEDTYMMNDIVIVDKQVGDAGNAFTKVSSIAFNIAETDLYAGSRGDPSRMASNFAGVQGADDSRNDLIIRGNSPLGVVNLVEGIPVPNLNHFAIPGSTGGPLSILNNKTLDNSAFYTGAFPSQYGNALAGIFDLNLKSGNDENHEFSGQLGFLGTELFAEGPITKNKSSYLATYRYSTLDLFNGLGIQIGTDALPIYQDAAFNVKLIGNNRLKMNLFGLGGTSKISIKVSGKDFKEIIENEGTYSEVDRDQEFRTSMGMTGLNAKWTFANNIPVEAAIAYSTSQQGATHFLTQVDNDNKYVIADPDNPFINYQFQTNKVAGTFDIAREFPSKNLINAGFILEHKWYDFQDSILTVWDQADPQYGNYTVRWNSEETATLLQTYAQFKTEFSSEIDMSVGIHSQFHSLNNSTSWLEPRLSINYTPTKSARWSLAFGVHSQTQPDYLYFYRGDKTSPYNRDLDFTRNMHFISGYEKRLENKIRVKVEAYFQKLDNIPIYDDSNSSYSIANMGSGFTRLFPDELINAGKGENYGLELTVERPFLNGFYYMVTASLYESKYVGGDGIWRDTEFNGNHVLNILGGKEWQSPKGNSFFAGAKFTTAGGRRYGEVDLEASSVFREIVFMDANRNEFQFDDYLRFDLNVNYKINRLRMAHEIGLDLVNVTNRRNFLKLTYIPPVGGDINPNGETREESQLGFLPIFFYKLSF